MSYYGKYGSDYGDCNSYEIWKYILIIIALIFLLCVMNSCSISEDREKQNMVTIDNTYVYDKDTLIVYREEIVSGYRTSSHATYSVYYNENGNKCRYIAGQFVEIQNSREWVKKRRILW